MANLTRPERLRTVRSASPAAAVRSSGPVGSGGASGSRANGPGGGRARCRVGPRRDDVDLECGIGRVVTFEHVHHDHGDVVAPAGGVGRVDERVGGRLRVGRGEQDRGDVGVGHLVDQTVAAQHEPVAADEGQGPPVDADIGFDAERPRDDVAARMDAGLFLVDVTGGDQFLHVAVIDGDTPQTVVAEQVGA